MNLLNVNPLPRDIEQQGRSFGERFLNTIDQGTVLPDTRLNSNKYISIAIVVQMDLSFCLEARARLARRQTERGENNEDAD